MLGDPRPWGGRAVTEDLRHALELLRRECVVGLTEGAARQAQVFLGEGERLRCSGYREPRLAQTFGVAHAVLRGLLAQRLGHDRPERIAFEHGRFGRPMLAGGGQPFFSLSYRPGVAAVALAGGPVGIDVERQRPDLDVEGISMRFFTPQECEALRLADEGKRLERFFQLWTRKEALVKAAGVGIDALGAAPALESSVRLHDDSGVLREFGLRGLDAAPGHAMALAWESARPSPQGVWP